ncbi:MAG TPA: anthranilate phosphoribosyltransferase [Acidimicrobiia bacterium]
MKESLDAILDGRRFTADEADALISGLTSGELDPVVVGAVLVALRSRGETPEEVRGFANGMRRLALRPDLDADDACDVVGTGGDNSGSLNLSTASALLAAAAGVPIVKHGNRSMSSQSGSADVLEAIGLKIPLDEQEAGEMFRRIGFTFLFAPYYHPAMGAVVPIRKSLGVRTIFNMLGPLTNPGRPGYALIGAWSLEAARLMADSLRSTEMKRVFVCHGSNGWDEPTPVGTFHRFEVESGSVTETILDPADFGFERCSPDDLLGGTPEDNAASIIAVFSGVSGPHAEAVVLGAALAIEVSGRAPNIVAGAEQARSALADGRALHLVESIGASVG